MKNDMKIKLIFIAVFLSMFLFFEFEAEEKQMKAFLPKEGYLSSSALLRLSGSSLILDMDGDGIKLQRPTPDGSVYGAYFDFDNDDFSEYATWIAKGDGLLAIDINHNGKIDNQSELFGNDKANQSGFMKLSAYDSNRDGLITIEDKQFLDLLIWEDSNLDGQSQTGEIKPLGTLGVSEINLRTQAQSSLFNNGSPVYEMGQFKLNNEVKEISDIRLSRDNANSRYKGSVTLDVRTLFLPTLRGFGKLKDLHIAMSEDPVLLDMLVNFVKTWSVLKLRNSAQFNTEIQNILFRWAKVENVAVGSRGQYINARELAFMEAFLGSPYGSNLGLVNYIPQSAKNAENAVMSYRGIFEFLRAALILQAGGGQYFYKGARYNISRGDINPSVLSTEKIIQLKETIHNLTPSERMDFWVTFSSFILQVKPKGIFTLEEIAALNFSISETMPDETWDSVAQRVQNTYSNYDLSGTLAADRLVGGAGADTLSGLAGDDTLQGMGANDILKGGEGDDTYIFNLADGVDQIIDNGGDKDVIEFGQGIKFDQVKLERKGFNLIIHYVPDANITIFDQFTNLPINHKIEFLKFAGGSQYDFGSFHIQ